MGGVSSKAAGALENDKKYNGIELNEDLGLNTYDAFFRNLDPQIGRWWQIDPKVENMEAWSPFVSNFNSPFRFNDPLGDEPCCEEVWKDIKSAAKETATSVYNGAVSVARTVNTVNPIASVLEVITGKSSASDFTESKPRMQAFADLGVNVVMLLTGEIGATVKIENQLSQSSKVIEATVDVAKTTATPKGLGNPFKNSTLSEVRNGFEKRAADGSMLKRGPNAYLNKKSGYSYNVDKGGAYGKGGRKIEAPHIDVNYPKPKPVDIPKKKLEIKPE